LLRLRRNPNMNARGNISARSRKRHVADLDALTRDDNRAHTLATDSAVRSPGANLGKPERLWATRFRYLNPA
jgi:hypothetical protein